MRSSEGLDPDADSFDPELAPVDYDDVAMAEAWAEEQADAAGGVCLTPQSGRLTALVKHALQTAETSRSLKGLPQLMQ